MEDEIWESVINFDGLYEISNLGRIKSCQRWVRNGKSERLVKERMLKLGKGKDGRMSANLYDQGKRISINVPKNVYMSFNRNCIFSKNLCIMHKNKIPSDNRLCNLVLTTIKISHKVNFSIGLLPHLNVNNNLKSKEICSILFKNCVFCGKNKKVGLFEKNRKKCIECRKIYKKLHYKKINDIKLVQVD